MNEKKICRGGARPVRALILTGTLFTAFGCAEDGCEDRLGGFVGEGAVGEECLQEGSVGVCGGCSGHAGHDGSCAAD